MNKMVCSKTMAKLAFGRYKHTKRSLSLPLKWITMTSTMWSSASHHIFCPIKCSLESKESCSLCYKYHQAKATID